MPRPRLPRRPLAGAPSAPPRAPAPADLPVGPTADAPAAPPGPAGPTWHPGGVAAWGADQVRAMMAYLEPEERMRFLALTDGLASVPETFRAFVARVSPGFQFDPFAERLIRVLQDATDGLRTRIMVFVVAQIGKSSVVSKLWPAYHLTRFPEHTIGLASYGANLAHGLAAQARAYYVRARGGAVFGERKRVEYWTTAEGGGMWATGTTRGAALGQGAHVLIVDDPHKVTDAHNERARRAVVEWWDETWTGRRRSTPDRPAILVLCMTRQGINDLAGEVLARESIAPQHWHIVKYGALATAADIARRGPPSHAIPRSLLDRAPAYARRLRPPPPARGALGDDTGLDDAQADIPDTCTLEPEFRTREGESVCEARKPAAEYRDIREGLGGEASPVWATGYQQEPTARGGGLFRVEKFRFSDAAAVPWEACDWVRAWDLASSEGRGDYTAGVRFGRHRRTGAMYVVDLVHVQYEPGKRDRLIAETAERDGFGVRVHFHHDPAQAGDSQVLALRDLIPEHESGFTRERVKLAARVGAWASDVNLGYVTLVRAPWNPAFVNEHRHYGIGGAHDDILAALASGRAYLAAGARARRELERSGGTRTLATADA